MKKFDSDLWRWRLVLVVAAGLNAAMAAVYAFRHDWLPCASAAASAALAVVVAVHASIQQKTRDLTREVADMIRRAAEERARWVAEDKAREER